MKIVITGGAGFIGCNAASRYLRAGHKVVLVDNLARRGARANVAWLKEQGPVELAAIDIRSPERVQRVFEKHADMDRLLHLAGQVAVTTSVTDPRSDFETNALGTLNVLESLRKLSIEAPLIFSSTNKVYGELPDIGVVKENGRYRYASLPGGVPETRALDFHSPYGCSKGAADQYTIDYHRIYGLKTTVFRQSCIYGWRQFGMEDQGWVAWFMIASLLEQPVTVYGDGGQIRDVLFIEDLLDAYDMAFGAGPSVYGQAYNVGGGPGNVLSILDVLSYIDRRRGERTPHRFDRWRPGDQKVFVSDIRKARADFGWEPKVDVEQGLRRLFDWVGENLDLFGKIAGSRTPETVVA